MPKTQVDRLRDLLEFEWRQLQDAAQLYKAHCVRVRKDGGVRLQGLQSAVFDSFAVHTRTLADFLFPGPNRRPDDLFADGAPAPSGYIPETMPAIIAAHIKKANKTVYHLTQMCLDDPTEDDAWLIDDLMAEFLRHLQLFASATGGVFSFKLEYPAAVPAPADPKVVAGSTR